MSALNHLFFRHPSPKTPSSSSCTIPSHPFHLSPTIPSPYLTLSIFSYAYLNETSFRVLSALCYDSYAFLREYRPQLHALGKGLSSLEFEEVEDNLGRDDRDNHTAGVNCLMKVDHRQFVTCSNDCTLKVWDCGSLACRLTYRDKYPLLRSCMVNRHRMLVVKYVSTLELMRVDRDDQDMVTGLHSLAVYHTPYSQKVLTLVGLANEEAGQFVTLYEEGVLPVYSVAETGITQYFKMEFTDTYTTDLKVIKQVSERQVWLGVAML